MSKVKTKKNVIKSKNSIPSGVMYLFAALVMGAVAAALFAVMVLFDVRPLIGAEENPDLVGNYLELIGVSFSITFITTSLFGGLSDKSEKIYWINYPESYLINTPLNFKFLSSLSFICLGIQTVACAFYKTGYEAVREALFLSSFSVGIIAIVILSYKFTDVFFSRKRFLNAKKKYFNSLCVNYTDKKDELEEAVIGIYNNTIEAVSADDNKNTGRIIENVSLLLEYSKVENEATEQEKETKKRKNNQTKPDAKAVELCSAWLSKLVIRIDRIDTAVLIQLYSLLDDKARESYTEILEKELSRRSLSEGRDEIIRTISDGKWEEIIKRIDGRESIEDEAGQTDPDEEMEWNEIGRDLRFLIEKIDIRRFSNCIDVLFKMEFIPVALIKQGFTEKTWAAIFDRFGECIDDLDEASFRELQKPLFAIVYRMQSINYDYDYNLGYLFVKDDEGFFNKIASDCINRRIDAFDFILDAIEDEDERDRFLLWFAEQMVIGNLDQDSISGRDYMRKHLPQMVDCIAEEIREKEKRILCSESAEENAFIYTDYFTRMLTLVSGLQKRDAVSRNFKRGAYFRDFLKIIFGETLVGKENIIKYIISDCDEDGWKEQEGELIINRYAIIFDFFTRRLRSEDISDEDIKEIIDRLTEFSDFLSVPRMSFALLKGFYDEKSTEQNKKELIFFLGHINRAICNATVPEMSFLSCVKIMISVLLNPCVYPIYKEKDKNPEEVNDSLSFIRSNRSYLSFAKGFIAEENCDGYEISGCYVPSSVGEMYSNADNYEQFLKDKKAADLMKKAADRYVESLEYLNAAL